MGKKADGQEGGRGPDLRTEESFRQALTRKRESKYVEFKETFDQSSPRDWCEIVKDIVAISNTGGGVILFGIRNNGSPSGLDVSGVSALDPARVSDKVYRYTRQHFSEFQFFDGQKDGQHVVGMVIGGSSVPIVFEDPGTYPIDDTRQKTAFSKGSVYFRHGAKSEPGTTSDLAACVERRLKQIRDEWLSGVRKVVSAEAGSHVAVVPRAVVQSADPSAFPIRLSEDPAAPVYRVVDVDDSYPYRQKELLEELGRRRPGLPVNSFDLLCARRAHGVDTDLRYSHTGRFSSRQYSEAFLTWLEEQVDANPDFFKRCRREYRRLQQSA